MQFHVMYRSKNLIMIDVQFHRNKREYVILYNEYKTEGDPKKPKRIRKNSVNT